MISKFLLFLALTSPSWALVRVSGWCEKGSLPVVAPQSVGGSPVSIKVQQSFPACTVQVYLTGTGTSATIYVNNSSPPTPLDNPFTASASGQWFFYAEGRFDVQISGGGLATPFTFGDIKAQDLVSVADYGAQCNGSTDDTSAILTAFASGNSLLIPDGSCVINNNSGPVIINNFAATVQFAGQARFVCTNAEGDCFYWTGGGPAKILGMRLAYQTPSTNYGECSGTFPGYPSHTGNCWYMATQNTSGFEFDHLWLEGGFGIGVLAINNIDLKLDNTRITNVTGGGMLLLNNKNLTVANVSLTTIGDDGIDIGGQTNYPGSTQTGATATNIVGSTIAGCFFKVGGTSHVKLSNFYGYDVHHSGICLENEPSSSEASVGFDDVTVANGTIANINSNGISTCYQCIFNDAGLDMVSDSSAGFGGRVFMANVSFQDMQGQGIVSINNINTNQMTELVLDNVQVKNTGISGPGTHAFSSCASLANIATIHINSLNCNTIAYNAVAFSNNGDVYADNVTIVNANTVGNSQHIALYGDGQNTIQVHALRVIDTANPPNSYIFGEESTANYGSFTDISGYLPNGTLTASIGSGAKINLYGQAGPYFYAPGLQPITITAAGSNLITLNATSANAVIAMNNQIAGNQAAISYQDGGTVEWVTGHLASNVSPADGYFIYDGPHAINRLVIDPNATSCSGCGSGRLLLNPTGAGVVSINNLQVYSSNTAARAAGLSSGDLYADSSGFVHVVQ